VLQKLNPPHPYSVLFVYFDFVGYLFLFSFYVFQPGNSWLVTKKRYTVLPCCVESLNHWVLIIADMLNNSFRIFDSFYGSEAEKIVYDLIKKHTAMNLNEWTFRPAKKQSPYQLPQKDTYSCGVFVAINFDAFMRFKLKCESIDTIKAEHANLVQYRRKKFVALMDSVCLTVESDHVPLSMEKKREKNIIIAQKTIKKRSKFRKRYHVSDTT